MKNGNSPLLNGIILAAIFAYLCFYFTKNGMWNIATIFVAILIAALAIGQFLLHLYLNKEQKKK